MKNEIELYVNKKFDIMKIIKMVLKRKGWGESYTLYSTPTHEVITTMSYYSFKDKYANFELKINEKHGSGYYSTNFNIYTHREDYTVKFINKLLLKTVRNSLQSYRKYIFDKESESLYPYFSDWGCSRNELIEKFNLFEEIEKIKSLELSNDKIETMIESIISKELDNYNETHCYSPRRNYVEQSLLSNKESQILSLINEIEGEIENEDN